MPKKGKGKGVAARQAKLSQKKNRSNVKPRVFAQRTTSSKPSSIVSNQNITDDPKPNLVTESPSYSRARTSSKRRDRGTTVESALTYQYLGSELRQIGIVTAIIGVILTVFTVALGG